MSESNSQRVAKNTGFLLVRSILIILVTLYTTRIILKALGFEDFGLYGVVGSVVVFFGFLQKSLNSATYRFLAYEIGRGDNKRLNEIYAMAINSHLLLATVIFILLEVVGVWFINNHLSIPENRLYAANAVFHLSLIKFCLGIARTPFNSNIIAHEHMKFYALVSIVEVLLRLSTAYLILWSPYDKLITYALLLSIVECIVLSCYIIYCIVRFKDCRYKRYWNTSLLKQFVSYSGWTLSVDVADVTTAQCRSVFFFNFLGSVANASLGIANQVIDGVNLFLTTFTQAYNPHIIKTYAAGKYDSFMRIIFSTSKLSFFILFLLSLPVVVNIEFILSIWLGDYPPLTPSFVKIVIIYYLIDACQYPLWTAVHATGKIKTHQILMASIKFLAIPSTYVSLKLGYSGEVAIAIWAFLNLCCAIVRVLYLHHLIKLNVLDYLKKVVIKILVVVLAVTPITFFVSSLTDNSLAKLVYTSLTSVCLTSLICYFYGLDSQERILLKTTVPIINKLSKTND